jgi:hypothetical protein
VTNDSNDGLGSSAEFQAKRLSPCPATTQVPIGPANRIRPASPERPEPEVRPPYPPLMRF